MWYARARGRWLMLARLCGSLVRTCGRAGVRVACSAARSLARALVRSLVAVDSLCGRACRLRGRSLVRSLVDVGSTCLIRHPISTVT